MGILNTHPGRSHSTRDEGVTWREQTLRIATIQIGDPAQVTRRRSDMETTPLNHAPGLNQLSVAFTKTAGGHIQVFVATSTPSSNGQNVWTHQKPPDRSGSFDQFRAIFASFPTNLNQPFGLSWMRTDFSGNVAAMMSTSTDGCVSWSSPSQVSTGTWTFPDFLTGDRCGMAAVSDDTFYPTWIARPGSQDIVVRAQWGLP
jgi:hypothetical protein